MAQTGNMLEGIETVQVYVRKGIEDDERYLSFRFPEWLSQGEVLDKGWAIDGNQVLLSASKSTLQTVESELVKWFRQKGYGITFC